MVQQEHVQFQTSDDVMIVGNFFPSVYSDAPVVLLLHMMPSTKESWDSFAAKLAEANFGALAIDLRGHGESVYKLKTEIEKEKTEEVLNYKKFSDEEHRASRLDVEAARRWLLQKGALPENIIVGGASIGANLALQYLAEHHEASYGFLLSPGREYRGIQTEPLMSTLRDFQNVFLAAAKDDEYAAATVRALSILGSSQKITRVYDEGGHGTTLFETHPELMDEIIGWLASPYIGQ